MVSERYVKVSEFYLKLFICLLTLTLRHRVCYTHKARR